MHTRYVDSGIARGLAWVAHIVVAAIGCGSPSPSVAVAPSPADPGIGSSPSATAALAEPSQRPHPNPRSAADVTGLPAVDAALGRLVPRATRESFPAPPDAPSSFEDLAATAEDELWVVGMGNLRMRCDARECKPMPAVTKQVPLGVVPGTCEAVPHFWHLLAGEGGELYVASTSACGMDPSYTYNRAIERFDGQRWLPLARSQLAGSPGQRTIRAMATAGQGGLWVLVEGFDWEGALANAIERYQGGQYAPNPHEGLAGAERTAFERALASPTASATRPTAWESFRSIVSSRDGRAWVVGSRVSIERSANGERTRLTPAAWFFDGRRWADAPLPAMPALGDMEALEALAIGADGTVWVGGEGLSRWSTDHFERIDLGGSAPVIVRSIHAVDRTNVWLVGAVPAGPNAGEAAVLHFDGSRLARVALDDGGDSPIKLAGRGQSLHALGRRILWSRQAR